MVSRVDLPSRRKHILELGTTYHPCPPFYYIVNHHCLAQLAFVGGVMFAAQGHYYFYASFPLRSLVWLFS